MGFLDKLRNAWNAFIDNDNNRNKYPTINAVTASSFRPDRMTFTRGNERSIVTAVYNRIAVDCASVKIRHVQLDEDGRYLKEMKSGLNSCLSISANKDQTPQAFIQDVVQSMFDEGCVAILPVDTEDDPTKEESYDIFSLRVGKITQWWPDYVQVEAYNDRKGIREQIIFPKSAVAIIENPLYSIMNAQNSTLQRLIRKLNILDAVDEQSGSGKLDLIIQLPYTIKTETRRKQAEDRRKEIENQLANSKYGIAYTDGTEHITQLNRPVENNLMKQIEFLTSMLYSQLGITQAILDGSADEKAMLNYMNRTVVPVISAITDEMKRKFLTKTAITQNKSIVYFNEPFKLIPITNLADIVDKFTRNEVMTSNEFRQIIGLKPSDDPNADELRNKNLNQVSQTTTPEQTQSTDSAGGEKQNENEVV